MEEEAMYQLKQLNADLNLIGGYNVHIDGGERDFGRVTLLDKTLYYPGFNCLQYPLFYTIPAYGALAPLSKVK